MYLTDLVNVEHLDKSLSVPFDHNAEGKRATRLLTLWRYLAQYDPEYASVIGVTLSILDQAIEIAFEETNARR